MNEQKRKRPEPAWNIPVDRALHQRLRLAAFEDERPQAEIIRQAVTEWLDRREAGKQEEGTS